jgi:hypothetical protein
MTARTWSSGGRAGKQQALAGWLEAFQDGDGAGAGVSGDPGGGDAAGGGFAFERQAGDLPPVDATGAGPPSGDAAAGQVLDYWWRGVIRSVCYSLLRKRRAAAAVSSIFWLSRDDRELVTLQTAATRPSSHAESSMSQRRIPMRLL